MKWVILESYSAEAMNVKVEDYLKSGWVIKDPIVVLKGDGGGSNTLYQTMTKAVKSTPKPTPEPTNGKINYYSGY